MSLFFVHSGSVCIDFPLSLFFLIELCSEQHKVGKQRRAGVSKQRRQPNVGLLLGQRCRRCANSKATLGQ